MSAASGISASPALTAAFADAVQSQTVRFIKVLIQNESLVHDRAFDIAGSFAEDLDILQDNEFVPPDSAAYVLAKLDPPSSPDWLSIFYVPDTANVREKMLYAATRLSLIKSLGSSVFTDSIFATSKQDLTPSAYEAHLKHVAAPNPLSAREQELADLRAAENTAATYQGSSVRRTHLETGVGLAWTTEVENAFVELARDSQDGAIVITIDLQKEEVLLEKTVKTDANTLGPSIPKDVPCYIFFGWQHSYKGNPIREIVFIYSCPLASPVKHRMIYASSAYAFYRGAKNLLQTSSPTTELSARRVETSDPEEINEAFLISQLDYTPVDQPQPAAESAPKGFAKPKGPPRRR